MFVHCNNQIILIGSSKEGYAGVNAKFFEDGLIIDIMLNGKITHFFEFLPIVDFIRNDLQRNNNNITDIFINGK